MILFENNEKNWKECWPLIRGWVDKNFLEFLLLYGTRLAPVWVCNHGVFFKKTICYLLAIRTLDLIINSSIKLREFKKNKKTVAYWLKLLFLKKFLHLTSFTLRVLTLHSFKFIITNFKRTESISREVLSINPIYLDNCNFMCNFIFLTTFIWQVSFSSF